MAGKLFLIDGNSYVYRSYYAIRGLKTSSGLPTNAVYGFASMIMKMVREEEPEYVAVAFDLPEPTFRHGIYADYKANRPSMPEELRVQFPLVREVLSALEIGTFERAGYEADDIIATIAFKFRDVLPVYVMSHDKDCLQLAGEGVSVIRENNCRRVYDAGGVMQVYGVPPELFPDVMALCGDASDNIPGIPGVGWKTAAKLVRRFGSLEGTIDAAPGLENKKLGGKIISCRDNLLLNKRLVTLDSRIPLEVELDSLKPGCARTRRVEEMFSRLEFEKLLDKL